MQLSRYFTSDELTFSDTAARKGIDNTPPASVMAVLGDTAKAMDEVRELLGKPIFVLSGYRCKRLNAAVGGVPTSGHLSGHAVDFVCPAFGTVRQVFDAIAKSNIKYDQLILEHPGKSSNWVHISFHPQMRMERLSYDGCSYNVAHA